MKEEQKINLNNCKKELDPSDTAEYIQKMWKSWFVKGLKDFVRVPNTTPRHNPDYCTDQVVDQAIECIDIYAEKLDMEFMDREIVWIPKNKFSQPPIVLYKVGHKTPEFFSELEEKRLEYERREKEEAERNDTLAAREKDAKLAEGAEKFKESEKERLGSVSYDAKWAED